MAGESQSPFSYSFGDYLAAAPVRPETRCRFLRGANIYSKHSVTRVDLLGSAAAPRSLPEMQRLCGVLGLPAPSEAGAEKPVGRCIEAVADSLRDYLDLPRIPVAAHDIPANAFVVPLDPEELNDAIIGLAIGIALEGRRTDQLQLELAALKSAAERFFEHIHMKALGQECRRRDIPWKRLAWSRHLHQIGEGSRQLRIDLTVSSRTGRIPTAIVSDKAETNQLLARFGIPVAKQIVVRSPGEAWSAARQIGFPVVVKPRFGRKGQAVSVRLSARDEIEAAAREALQLGSGALVESHIVGLDHRILVAAGKIIAVARRLPAQVTGDGRRTVRQLVELENRNPHRSEAHRMTVLKTIDIDSEMVRRLADQGLTLDSIPPAGASVWLRFGGNLSTGATAEDVTELIHPRNAKMLIRAVELVDLDIAGVDFLTTDIAKPYDEVGAAICEINSRVATRAHMAAELGTGRSVVGRLLEAIYNAPGNGRLPVLVLLGRRGEPAAETLAGLIAEKHGLRVAIAGPDRIVLGGESLAVRHGSLGEAHGLIVEDPSIDFVILEAEPDLVEADGLGVSYADLVVDRCACAPKLRPILEKTGAGIVDWKGADDVVHQLRTILVG